MNTNLLSVLQMKKFFRIVKQTETHVNYILQKPSQILLKNIHIDWLYSVHSKTINNMIVHLQPPRSDTKTVPFGIIKSLAAEYADSTILEHDFNESYPKQKSPLVFKLIVPPQDAMQFFIQWQRYRKYWWSSITTTPSLFAIADIQHKEAEANVDIVARFPFGHQTVEHINIKSNDDNYKDWASVCCTSSLEGALLALLLDASSGRQLRLHRTMAPYKMSFALDFQEPKSGATLRELAGLLCHKLRIRKISAWLPSFGLPLQSQISESHQMGVTYTAILRESTLNCGVLHLLDSSTLLEEQVHVSDFDAYAAQICCVK